MSRCFPFPPPGYEKEARNDDIELLQKEKHKEKKHKKEKKDKEKREDKEKRDKERSKDKNKEKKERKEKHNHKKKEKDRDKEKNSTPGDNRTVKGRNEGCNEEKLGESSSHAVDRMETKLKEELGKRVKNEARPAENQMFRETNAPVQRTSESMFNAPDQRRAMGHMETKLMEEQGKRIKNEARPAENQMFRETIASVQRRNENVFNAPNKKKAVGHMEAKLTAELGKRIKNEARPAENQVFRETIAPIQRRIESMFNAPDQRRVESLGRAVEKEKEKGTAQKEKKEGDNRRPERRDDSVGGTAGNIIMGQITNGTDQSAGQQRSEGKEKHKDKKSKEGDDRGGDRHKDKNREEKRSKRKDKKRNKEKEKEKDKVKEKCEDRPEEWDRLKDSQRELMNAVNIKAPVPPTSSNNSEKSIGSEGNLKKRKDFETNGFAYENDLHPTKLPRLASSSQMPLENGKNFESSHISIRCSSERREGCSSERLGETNYRKGEINKEHKINGTVKVQPSAVISMRTSVPLEPLVDCEASNRPPHPDSIRLNQLLSIPKMEEWSDFDDQEWLFSSNCIHSKPTAPDAATETTQVWREALRIESADVIALPYVIPF